MLECFKLTHGIPVYKWDSRSELLVSDDKSDHRKQNAFTRLRHIRTFLRTRNKTHGRINCPRIIVGRDEEINESSSHSHDTCAFPPYNRWLCRTATNRNANLSWAKNHPCHLCHVRMSLSSKAEELFYRIENTCIAKCWALQWRQRHTKRKIWPQSILFGGSSVNARKRTWMLTR